MHPLKADAEFVNPVAQEVGLGPPQFVPHLPESLQTEITLVLCARGQFAEPVQKWARSVRLPVQDDSRSGRSIPVYSLDCEIANEETEKRKGADAVPSERVRPFRLCRLLRYARSNFSW